MCLHQHSGCEGYNVWLLVRGRWPQWVGHLSCILHHFKCSYEYSEICQKYVQWRMFRLVTLECHTMSKQSILWLYIILQWEALLQTETNMALRVVVVWVGNMFIGRIGYLDLPALLTASYHWQCPKRMKQIMGRPLHGTWH